ncbi:hypothetical protein [Bradyrhizobium sp. SZCCHNR1083]|uniref:hypothetical protein n=1 Tax=Bradyrhizobium sp. SZCCHNR1083 TaxID=3057364 RepID=UPI0028EF0E1A|nr:hypothetical protein [Bradyrhizobium sp. SZCCHNR1083]
MRRRRTRFVIVFAGCTHTTARWLDGLAENGRLLLPLTTEDWSGFLLRAAALLSTPRPPVGSASTPAQMAAMRTPAAG